MQTIPTPEGVTLEVELAGLGSRTVALIFDMVLVMFIVGTLTSTLQVILIAVMPEDVEEFFAGFLAAFGLATLLAMWGLAVWMDGSTPGKRGLGLRVVGADGTPVGSMQHLIRTLLLPLDIGFLFVGPILMFFSPRPRRLGDWAAGTVVVRSGNDELLLDPWLKQNWKARDAKAFELSPGVAARFDEADLALMRDIILRRDLEPAAARALYRDAAHVFCAKAGVTPTSDPRRALKEIFLFLRAARGV